MNFYVRRGVDTSCFLEGNASTESRHWLGKLKGELRSRLGEDGGRLRRCSWPISGHHDVVIDLTKAFPTSERDLAAAVIKQFRWMLRVINDVLLNRSRESAGGLGQLTGSTRRSHLPGRKQKGVSRNIGSSTVLAAVNQMQQTAAASGGAVTELRRTKKFRFESREEAVGYIDHLLEECERLCSLTGVPMQPADGPDRELHLSVDRKDSVGL